MKYLLTLLIAISSLDCFSQNLKLRKRAPNALTGTEFSKSIRDSTLSLDDRELLIFQQIRSGNIPNFYRRLTPITDTLIIKSQNYIIKYFVIPDFLAVGSDEDYFYTPMRPQLAQRVADLVKCSLPTRKISDQIYKRAVVKMTPEPIPPSPQMVTIPVFEKHNILVNTQRRSCTSEYPLGMLVAGNKKDVVISNKILNNEGLVRVVIYGWHKPDGKAIQPLYNGHNTLHVDYSHGIRLVQNKLWINGRRTTVQKILASETLHPLLSDENIIKLTRYPLK